MRTPAGRRPGPIHLLFIFLRSTSLRPAPGWIPCGYCWWRTGSGSPTSSPGGSPSRATRWTSPPDGEEALQWTDVGKFDVIILDVMLPGRNGIDVCRTLRARGLELIDRPEVAGRLQGYQWLHSSRADLLRRLERDDEAAEACRRALSLSDNAAERSFIAGRLQEMETRRKP